MLIVCIAALTALLCFCSFAWGVSRHFRHDAAMPRGMRLLSYGSLAALLWFLVRLAVQGLSPAWPLAIVLMLAALGLFWSTVHATRTQRLTLAFCADTPMFLHRHGPYAFVRHPFYSAYILFWIATSLSSPGIIQWLAPVALGCAYVHAARMEERKFANSPLATDYRLYQHGTGLMLPLLWRDPRSWAIVPSRPSANQADHRRRDQL